MSWARLTTPRFRRSIFDPVDADLVIGDRVLRRARPKPVHPKLDEHPDKA